MGRIALISLLFFTISALLVASGCVGSPGLSGQQVRDTDIYVLAGQSNMSGRGIVPPILPPEIMPDPAITLYGNDGRWWVASEPLDSATSQIDSISIDTMAGVGPGLAYAKLRRAADPSRKIILVPCAKGGSSMSQWIPNLSRTTLYGSCLARIKEARTRGRLAGMLWYQGETDASDATTAAQWGEKLSYLITRFRTDLALTNLPILLVGLADPPQVGKFSKRFPAWSIVQEEQAKFRLPGVRFVSATALEKLEDDLHLSTQGQIDLAERMFVAEQAE